MNSFDSTFIKFPVEIIGEKEKLFYRIHQVNIDKEVNHPKRKIKPSAFDPQPKGNSVNMSVNWQKYCLTAEDAKNKAKNPVLNGIVSFISTSIRNHPILLDVKHSPGNDQSHSHIHEVLSEKNDPEIRMLLRESCSWEIEI